MKKLSIFFTMILLNSSLMFSQVAINIDGSAPDSSAMFDVKSTTKGVLFPQMTLAELIAIVNPADGLLVYCTDCGSNSVGTFAMFTVGAWYTINADCLNPMSPLTGTHVASHTQIVWKWLTVAGATGYKWSTTNDFDNAIDLGLSFLIVETGLTCNTNYTRYVWAYGECGNSTLTTLTQTTSTDTPASPTSGTHVSTPIQIIWNWNAVSGATGYKWSTTNDFDNATDLGLSLLIVETGLTCNTNYTRCVWAYVECGNSTMTTLTQTTSTDPPASPTSGTHVSTPIQIIWNWNAVSGATGYKWSETNNYATATDMGTVSSKTETGLSCGTSYTRYVWAYNTCGISTVTPMSCSTQVCCGSSFTINHIAGNIAPVTKTTTYGNVTNIPGETSKCWITNNLGADHQATAVNDATEESAGWYWQFNKQQGYKHDGTTRTPNTTWITSIIEDSDWLIANDPCALLLGSGWRLPTSTEWTNVDASGGWAEWNGPWNSDLKMHAAGRLHFSDGSLVDRSSSGLYWSSKHCDDSNGYGLYFNSSYCIRSDYLKAYGFSSRCLRD